MKRLVRDEGFRAIALEGYWQDAEAVRTYLQTCEADDLLLAMTEGLTFSVWASTSTADLLTWLCDFNAEHPDDPVVFFSVDVQEPWRDVQLLRTTVNAEVLGAHLDTCIGGTLGPDEDPYENAAVLAVLEGNRPTAESHLACLTGVEAVEAAGPWPFETQVALRSLFAGQSALYEQFVWDPRDLGMAELLVLQRDELAPGARTIYWAHNAHIVDDGELLVDSVYPAGWRDAGSHLGEWFGDRYAAIGFIAEDVRWNWPGQGDNEMTSERGSVERKLSKLGASPLFVDSRQATAAGGVFEPEQALTFGHPGTATGVPGVHYRGFVYLDRSSNMDFWSP
jgi:erythromycin esterase-like protein